MGMGRPVSTMVVPPAVGGARSPDGDLLWSVRAPGSGLASTSQPSITAPICSRAGRFAGLVVEPTQQSVVPSARPVDTNLKPSDHVGPSSPPHTEQCSGGRRLRGSRRGTTPTDSVDRGSVPLSRREGGGRGGDDRVPALPLGGEESPIRGSERDGPAFRRTASHPETHSYVEVGRDGRPVKAADSEP